MNNAEYVGYKHLLSLGYKAKEIKYGGTALPDFRCSDGKRFEVKMPPTLIFTRYQIENFKEDDVILVVNALRVIDQFLWRDRNIVGYNIRVKDREHETSYKQVADAIRIMCHLCKNVWDYRGRSGYACCPRCHRKVNVSKNKVEDLIGDILKE